MTKQDLRAVCEFGCLIAGVGALVGWLGGFSILAGAAAFIVFFGVALALGYLFESVIRKWRGE